MNKQTFLVGAVATVCLLAVCLKRRRQKNRRRMWVNPYLQGRWFGGRFNDVSIFSSMLQITTLC